MKKILLLAITAFIFSNVLTAETIEKTEKFNSFKAVSVTDGFSVTLKEGTQYGSTLNVDTRLFDFCHIELKDTTLCISVNTKEFPKELKAQIRKEQSPMVKNVVVTVPDKSAITCISLYDNAVLNSEYELNAGSVLKLFLYDKSSVKQLNVTGARLEIEVDGESKFDAKVKTGDAKIVSKGKGESKLDYCGKRLEISSENRSKVSASAQTEVLYVTAANSSSVSVNGKSGAVMLNGRNFAVTDASKLQAEEVSVHMEGGKTRTGETKELKISMSAGASLVFDGEPNVRIEKIVSSSVTRRSDETEKTSSQKQ